MYLLKSCTLDRAEAPEALVDTAFVTLRTTLLQAAADDQEQIKRREKW